MKDIVCIICPPLMLAFLLLCFYVDFKLIEKKHIKMARINQKANKSK